MDIMFEPKVQANVNNEVLRRHLEIEETIEFYFSEINQDSIMQFKLFGFDNDICNKVKNILAVKNYKIDNCGHQMTEELMSVLMLSKFSFVSYDYVNQNEEIFEIVG